MVEERHTQRRARNVRENKLNKRARSGESEAARTRGGGEVRALKRQHAGEDVHGRQHHLDVLGRLGDKVWALSGRVIQSEMLASEGIHSNQTFVMRSRVISWKHATRAALSALPS